MTPLTVTLAADGSIPVPDSLRHAGLSAGDPVVLESDGHTLLVTPAAKAQSTTGRGPEAVEPT